MSRTLLLDDHSLIDEILSGSVSAKEPGASILTAGCWYYRACRGAVLGAGGQLSGPFERLDIELQRQAIASLLSLPERIEIPSSRTVVPVMVRLAQKHSKLNLMNLEAVAIATLTGAHVLLAERASVGVLPPVLDSEQVSWSTHR